MGEAKYLIRHVVLPDKFTDDQVAHNPLGCSMLDHGSVYVSQARAIIQPIDHNPLA